LKMFESLRFRSGVTVSSRFFAEATSGFFVGH
jgi:hypothetical protein